MGQLKWRGRLRFLVSLWEYRSIGAYASRGDHGTAEAFAKALNDQWLSKLNELGAEGWELVSEIHQTARDPREPHWVMRIGTMKRPSQS
jgi:hypothetical protein